MMPRSRPAAAAAPVAPAPQSVPASAQAPVPAPELLASAVADVRGPRADLARTLVPMLRALALGIEAVRVVRELDDALGRPSPKAAAAREYLWDAVWDISGPLHSCEDDESADAILHGLARAAAETAERLADDADDIAARYARAARGDEA